MNKSSKKGLVPALRFPEFKGTREWEVLSGNKAFQQISNKNHSSDLPILAITQEYGAIPRELIDYKVSATDKSIQSYKVVEVGDFVISLRSFQGGIEYSNYKGICSPAYVILRKKNNVNECFFKQYFKTPAFIRDLTKNLEGLRDGKMISYKQFSDVPLPLPSMAEQQKIADCLSSLDELITAHIQKNQALQSYKKGLMQNLFPVEGEAVPALRFPEFDGCEEWNEWKFGDLVSKSFYGTSQPTSVSGSYPVLRMGNMTDGKIDNTNIVYINLSEKEFKKIKLKRGDILFNRTNSPDLVGKVSLFDSGEDCITASYIVTFRLNSSLILPAFGNQLLNTGYYQRRIKALATRAVSQANINPTRLKEELLIFIPQLLEQQEIAAFLSSVDDLITAQAQKIEDLKTYKKGLMQQLFPTVEEVGA